MISQVKTNLGLDHDECCMSIGKFHGYDESSVVNAKVTMEAIV